MMKQLKGVVLLSGIILALTSSAAQARVLVDVVGALTYPLATGTPAPSGNPGLGGGLNFNFKLGTRVALEVGGFYLSRVYTSGTANTLTMLDAEVGLKFYLLRALFLDGGGYVNYYLTNPQGLAGRDLGLFGGLGLQIPFSPTFALLLKGHYHYALQAMTYSTKTITPSEAIGFVGFTFGMNMLSK